MAKANLPQMLARLRGAYAKAGIKSKADAYSLANQAFAEKRISDTELVGMQKSFDMIFDSNGADKVGRLTTGRAQGLAAAKKRGATRDPNKMEMREPTMTREEMQAANAQRYAQGGENA